MKTHYTLALMVAAGILSTTSLQLRADTTSPDEAINKEIFHLLLADTSLARGSDHVAITVQNGAVTITGDVVAQRDKQRLSDAISKLPGVQSVNDDQLALHSWGAPVAQIQNVGIVANNSRK